MKLLTESERLEVVMNMLTEEQVDEYAERCKALEQDCERNGFHNTPAECENFECSNCTMVDSKRYAINCPYVDLG